MPDLRRFDKVDPKQVEQLFRERFSGQWQSQLTFKEVVKKHYKVIAWMRNKGVSWANIAATLQEVYPQQPIGERNLSERFLELKKRNAARKQTPQPTESPPHRPPRKAAPAGNFPATAPSDQSTVLEAIDPLVGFATAPVSSPVNLPIEHDLTPSMDAASSSDRPVEAVDLATPTDPQDLPSFTAAAPLSDRDRIAPSHPPNSPSPVSSTPLAARRSVANEPEFNVNTVRPPRRPRNPDGTFIDP